MEPQVRNKTRSSKYFIFVKSIDVLHNDVINCLMAPIRLLKGHMWFKIPDKHSSGSLDTGKRLPNTGDKSTPSLGEMS